MVGSNGWEGIHHDTACVFDSFVSFSFVDLMVDGLLLLIQQCNIKGMASIHRRYEHIVFAFFK